MQHAERSVRRAVARGFANRCPACGDGAVLIDYLTPVPRCTVCGERLGAYATADFAPYLVMVVVGVIFMPLVLLLAATPQGPEWIIYVIILAALSAAWLLLPHMKGAVVGLHWALDVSVNE